MATLYQNVGWRAVSGAGVLCVLWVAVGASPAVVQHRLIQELVTEASNAPILMNSEPAKTHAWLQRQFVENEFSDIDPGKAFKVKGYGAKRVVDYEYEVRRPLFRNINFVMHFKGTS